MRDLITILPILLLVLPLRAQDVPEKQIVETASAFVKGYLGSEDRNVIGVRKLRITGSTDLLVIDLSPEGWLLMSDDYSALPVLGFSLTGSFTDPPADPCDNRFAFLSGYSEQLKSALTEKSSRTDPRWDPAYYYTKAPGTNASKATVLPLIKVTWNQGNGWNRFCPEDEDGPGGHVYVGCMAVSMGQAMSTFGTPSSGTGSNEYLHPDYGRIYADFSNAVYNWSAMSASIPDDNNALLLFHCAVSVNMDFASDGSGAITSAAASSALKQFFFYSKKTTFVKRGTDTEVWKSRLDSSLLEGCPIMYSGFPATGSAGHAFNIDGVYNSNYYHVNWGWSGVDNGYYTIDNLKPGGSDYTKSQEAVLWIRPYYYPTGIEMSDTLVLLSYPAGKAVGKFNVVDEATDNTYNVTLECDSTFTDTAWEPDYYLDGDSLRATRSFQRIDGPVDTVTFIIEDTHGNLVHASQLLLLTASLSADDGEAADGFSVYPVPVTDQFVITLPAATARVTVTDLHGREVAGFVPYSDRVTVAASDMAPGLYIVTITTGDGRRYSRSVVKD